MTVFKKLFKTFIPFAVVLIGVLLFAIIGHFYLEVENPVPVQIIRMK